MSKPFHRKLADIKRRQAKQLARAKARMNRALRIEDQEERFKAMEKAFQSLWNSANIPHNYPP